MKDRSRLTIRDVDQPSPLRAPASERQVSAASTAPPADEDLRETPLFAREEADGFRSRWEAIQTGFVDQPREAVQEADALVSDVVTRLARVFGDERAALEEQWARGETATETATTEELRLALKRYRVFFHRLLSL